MASCPRDSDAFTDETSFEFDYDPQPAFMIVEANMYVVLQMSPDSRHLRIDFVYIQNALYITAEIKPTEGLVQ